jgi:hypothetical protein
MFESQVEEYIGKALVAEANGDGAFLSESEIAFRVTGMMYADKIKSDGPVSLRSVKGKMGKVRTMCDEKSLLLIMKTEDDTLKWKIATGDDLDYIAETYLGIKVEKDVTPESESVADKAPDSGE